MTEYDEAIRYGLPTIIHGCSLVRLCNLCYFGRTVSPKRSKHACLASQRQHNDSRARFREYQWFLVLVRFLALIKIQNGSFRAGMITRMDVCRELETHTEKVEAFFRTMHPGIIPNLMSPQSAIEQFVSHPHISLRSVKCSNFGYGDSAVLLGDSSHSMTPFFAMGMITGLEDVRIFFEDFIDPAHRSQTNNEKVERPFCPTGVVREHTDHRRPDVRAMTDMAAEHYHELNTGV